MSDWKTQDAPPGDSSVATKVDTLTSRPGWDALLLALLVFALLQIVGLAESSALPTLLQDVVRHPWLGGLLSPQALAAFGEVGPRPGDPIGLIVNATALLLLILYLVVDLALRGAWRVRVKWLLLTLVILVVVALPTVELMLLRAQSGPASYTHDGGVIQTEATIRYLLEGKNPYVEDYTQTPMAEWGFGAYRTALYHYPYLPWTFLFSAPFYMGGQALGGYDQRIVYLLLYAIMLLFLPRLTVGVERKLALVMLVALNPIMGLDIIFGQNDLFVLAWIVFALVAWRAWKRRRLAGASATLPWLLVCLFYGLACASKPTAWFLAPFLALLMADSVTPPITWRAGLAMLWQGALRLLPAFAIFLLVLLPWLLSDPYALYDDVWRWSSGQGETGYQIWGWGAANFVLALGWVQSRFDHFPFLLAELALGIPLLVWLLVRQARQNTLANACWHYALFLLVFFFVSRFLNENYLGFMLAFLAIGALAAQPMAQGEVADGLLADQQMADGQTVEGSLDARATPQSLREPPPQA